MTDHSQSKRNTTEVTAQIAAERVQQSLAKRYRKERLFRIYGIISVMLALLALFSLFSEILGKGAGAFKQTYIEIEVEYNTDDLGVYAPLDAQKLMLGNYGKVISNGLKARFPDVKGRRNFRQLKALVSIGAEYALREKLQNAPELLGKRNTFWLLADDDVDTYYKSINSNAPFTGRLSEKQRAWVGSLIESQQIKTRFNWQFFTSGDSAEPELAGISGALLGSFFTLLITLVLSFPIGVAAAVYLEEFAPKNRFTDFIEVNINNLAAVPSIIFGLLGLAIFLNLFGFPRSIPLVGGLVLTLMTLPTVIISSRAALKSVPNSVREAAQALGASRTQVTTDHVLPQALPGMLTGTIIGMAQALGETAPLLMIGMVAFIVDLPQGVMDPATVLPVQVYLWSDSPERAFVEKTSAAIMVLLVFLILMNAGAIWLRKHLQRK